MMNRPLTVAVAGCGSRGQDTYAKILVTMPEKARRLHKLTGLFCCRPVSSLFQGKSITVPVGAVRR